jgi:hypothetical protein
MNRTQVHSAAAAQRHTRSFAADAIEWEELPSLARTLRRGDLTPSVGHVWLSTEPMPLQPLQSATAPRPARLVEPIIGLLVQEIESDGVFRHFFGDDRANH